jgi:hypothetical protein
MPSPSRRSRFLGESVGSPALELEAYRSGAPDSRRASKRPVPVTLVAALIIAVGVYNVVDGMVVLVNGGDNSKLAEGAFEVAFGVFVIAIGNGALRMRRWAWAAFMTLAVVGLTQELLRHFFYDHPSYLNLALIALVVFALTPLDVQIAFGVRPPRNVLLEKATRNPIDSV